MKISFSTLGCPSWTLREILSTAKDLGYDGIELRGLGSELFMPDAKPFTGENLAKTCAMLKASGIAIPVISTECAMIEGSEAGIKNVRAYIDLARSLGAPYIRVLGDSNPWPDDTVDEKIVCDNLIALAPYAQEKGVAMLVESNGIFANSLVLRNLLERVGSPAVQALWDINHPVRYFAEAPEVTWGNIGAHVRHVHIKDSVMTGGTMHYKMLGHGDLPIKSAIKILKENAFSGYVSLEWTKRWNAELEDAGIVFSHFAYAIRKMIEEA
ncbi:MAG: sugar phosphate isomerase/epimerase family protein [Clostridia bacterium]